MRKICVARPACARWLLRLGWESGALAQPAAAVMSTTSKLVAHAGVPPYTFGRRCTVATGSSSSTSSRGRSSGRRSSQLRAGDTNGDVGKRAVAYVYVYVGVWRHAWQWIPE